MTKTERLDFIHDLRKHFEEERSFYEDKLQECKRIHGFEQVHDLLIQGQEMSNRALNDLTGAEAGVENYDDNWNRAKKLYGIYDED